MPDGGTLDVRVRAAGEGCRITFADNGPGLAPHQFEKIFEPFQSGFSKGTGLGLAIVYDIVQAHDGKITVQSAPGQGTQFTLELKRAANGRQQSAVGAGMAAGGR
jgi:signal transduction histidine kinase